MWYTRPKNFLIVASSVADAVVVNPNYIKMLLATGLVMFFIKDNLFVFPLVLLDLDLQ